ncbi:ABC transporter permease [Streptomyces sp. NBC_01335]|uniref:ABC transporter permease n=1 Tax=Streptomyces sp. NBC_01335 TaxID=2903828 RepID=UPI002E152D31|nr:ABC transporter permease [Streptomyces sp. NBC_01335]
MKGVGDSRGLARRLLTVGRVAGRRSEAGGARFVALLLATVVLVLGLGTLVAVHAVYTGQEERRVARTPVVERASQRTESSTVWLVGSDTLDGERRFSVVYLAPHRGDAPLPPGVDHWPAPGQAVLSPALREAGANEDIDHRYGELAGTIGSVGLDESSEWLAYVRPRDGLGARPPSALVSGFGPTAGQVATGLEPGSGRYDNKPEWMFEAVVAGMVVLPGLALLVVGVRIGAHARDRRTALVAALGGKRRDRALVAVGEAQLPALIGAALGAAVVATAMLRDLRIPHTGYALFSAYLREHGWGIALVPVVAFLVVLAAVVIADLAPRRGGGGTRPRSAARNTWMSRLAALCPVMMLVAIRGPDFAGPGSAWHMILGWAGTAGTMLTLPAAVATVTMATGRVLTRQGQTHGLAGTLVAGRRTSTHPGATARLVTGITVALIVLMQAIAWQDLFASQSTDARYTLNRIGRSAVSVGTRGTVTTADMTTFLRRLPDTEAVLLTPPTNNHNGPITLYGDCTALTALRLPCPPHGARADGVPEDPRLRELVRWTPHGALILDIRRTTRDTLARLAAASSENATFAVLRPDGNDLSVPALKKLSYEVFPRGARIGAPGEDQLTAGMPNQDQGRWSVLFGVFGIAVLAVTAGLSGVAEFLRHGRALAPLSVLTGGLRVFRTSAAWAVLAPLALAGLAGTAVAAALAAPINANGVSYITRELLWSVAGVVLVIGILMWMWAVTVSTRLGQAWRPRGD